MIQILLTDGALLEDIGHRLAQRRIDAGLTQSALARQAGVGRSTVERLEAGRSTQMVSFVRVLRVLDLLTEFVELVPEKRPGPMDLLKSKPKERKRAFSRRGAVRGDPPEWTWGSDS